MMNIFRNLTGGFLATFFLIAFATSLKGQVIEVKDTANVPIWVDMMEDPNANYFETVQAFEKYWKDRSVVKGSGYKQFKRWQYAMGELIDADGNKPSSQTLINQHQKAFRPMPPQGGNGSFDIPGGPGSATCLTEGNWVDIGPENLPGNKTSQPNGLGRVNALAFHPNDSNTLFAGTPAGGLWKSSDHGISWTTNTDTLLTLGVSAIAIDPDHPDTMYLGTGDRDASDSYGRGVMKSTDGGASWKTANSNMGNVTVARLVIDPSSTNTLLAATTNGIWRTTNGGNSWTRVNSTGAFRELVLRPGNSNYIYAARYNPPEFHRSTDNGVNWTKITSGITSGGRNAVIGVTPDDNQYVYYFTTETRAFKAIYLSTDAGATFTSMATTPNLMDYSTNGSGTGGQAWYDLDMAVDPTDKSVVYMGGVNIFKSTNSGSTWSISAHWVGSGGADDIHADQHILEFSPVDGHLYIGNDGGVFRTKDDGKNYESISEGMSIAQIYRLSQSKQSQDWLINGYQDNGTGMLQDGTWQTVMGGDGMYCQIDPSTDNYAYSDLYYGDVRRYTNGTYSGKIAANGTNGINETGAWVTPFILQEGSPGTMFIGYKNVWRSTNIKNATAGSVTWTKISTGLGGTNGQNVRHLENSAADPNVLFMSRYDSKMFRTTNANAGAPNWTEITGNLPASGNVVWIETDPKRSNTLWVVRSNKIYESTDQGSSWTNITNGLPSTTVLSLVHDSSSVKRGMYAGTYFGVYYKDTTMSAWVWFNKNMPTTTRVRDLDIYYHPTDRSKSHVVAATYGRGNWRSPLYDEDKKTPVALMEVSSTNVCSNNVVELKDLSLNTPTQWHWKITPNEAEYVAGSDSCSQFASVIFKKKGTYTIRLIAENCDGSDTLTKTDYISVGDTIATAACIPGTNNENFNIGIFKVEIDSQSFSSLSTKDEGGYVEKACSQVFTLLTDTEYDAKITTSTGYDEQAIIFIDYNNDGDFQDGGELVGHTQKGRTNLRDTITTAAFPVTNTILRMRIRSDYNTVVTDPCTNLTYGQTEDFGVVFIPKVVIPKFAVSRDSTCSGDTVTLTDITEGNVADWEWIIHRSSATDTIKGQGPHVISVADTGYVAVEMRVNAGVDTSYTDSAFYVIPTPVLYLDTAGDAVGCELRDLDVVSKDSLGLAVFFTWLKDGVDLAGANQSLIRFNPIQFTDSGSYQSITNYLGCRDTSEVMRVLAHPVPVVGFDLDSTTQCFNGNEFSVNSTTTLTFGNFVVNWNFNDEASSSLLGLTHSFTAIGNKFIELSIATDRNCLDTLTKWVDVRESPVAGFTVNQAKQCFDGHEVKITNSSSVNAGTLTQKWIYGDGNNSQIVEPNITYSNPGNFDIALVSIANQCSDTLLVNVTIDPNPLADFTMPQNNYCLKTALVDFTDNSTILSGSIASLEWDFGDGAAVETTPNPSHVYAGVSNYNVELRVNSDQNCTDTISKVINVWNDPIANFNVNEQQQCMAGNQFVFTDMATIALGSLTDKTWTFGDGSNATDATLAPVSYAAPGSYTVSYTVTSDKNCVDSLKMVVDVYENPTLLFLTDVVCLGEPSVFDNQSGIITGSITNYNWRFGDGTRSSIVSPSHVYPRSGSFDVELWAETDQGCVDSAMVVGAAVVNELPTADFTYEVLSSWLDETNVKFTDGSFDHSNITWDFSLGQYPTDPVVEMTFNDTGYITVKLYAENSIGCKDTSIQEVFVFPTHEGLAVSSFSPNDDDLNDEFGISGLRFVEEFELRVYNRWGTLVYSSEDITQKWDGKMNGSDAAQGMYIYTITYIDLLGEYHKLNGVLHLTR